MEQMQVRRCDQDMPIAKKHLVLAIAAVLSIPILAIPVASHAETETATASSSEVIVAGKILQQQMPENQADNAQASDVGSATPLQVPTDLSEGSFRQLPTLNEPVIDQANILTASEQQLLSQKIFALHEQGIAQIGVVIVPSTGQEPIFDYALRVAEAWQLGTAKQDNGILMVIAINDRRIQILTGYGMEGVLPDIMVSRVISQYITPHFKQNQFAQGIDAGLNETIRLLQQDPEITRQAAETLKERQEQALQAQQARDQSLKMGLVIVLVGIFASMILGRRLAASTAGVAGVAAGLVSGLGLVGSLVLGIGIFFLLITSLAQLILQGVLSGAGRGGSGRGGFGGGGFSGGGGGFGGGGASGSW